MPINTSNKDYNSTHINTFRSLWRSAGASSPDKMVIYLHAIRKIAKKNSTTNTIT
jgi:hypothetical protein